MVPINSLQGINPDHDRNVGQIPLSLEFIKERGGVEWLSSLKSFGEDVAKIFGISEAEIHTLAGHRVNDVRSIANKDEWASIARFRGDVAQWESFWCFD